MNYIAEIKIMPLKELLDPAGKAVSGSLQKLGISQVEDVRIGKHIELHINCHSENDAMEIAGKAVKLLLANPVMEHADIVIRQES